MTQVEIRYIEELEKEIGLKFPDIYKARMVEQNGGVIETKEYDWHLFPFFDKSDPVKIMSTCDHIGIETRNAKVWDEFPEDAVAIGKNEYGDLIILSPDQDQQGMLSEIVYLWVRETGEVIEFAKNIHQVQKSFRLQK